MNSATNRYLDEVLERLQLPSDYALAEVLGLSTQAIYKMRGGGMMGAATAARIAHLLQLDALQVIADTEFERTDDPFWKRVRDAAVIAALAIGAASFGVPQPVEAAISHNYFGGRDLTVVHIASSRRRRSLLAAFVAWVLGGSPR